MLAHNYNITVLKNKLTEKLIRKWFLYVRIDDSTFTLVNIEHITFFTALIIILIIVYLFTSH